MQSISTKELRQKMPLIRSQLAKGESFLIIYRSQPIGTLTPIDKNDLPWEKTKEGKMGMKAQDEDIARNTDPDEYLTEKEVKYYLNRINEYEAR